ncbi:MAG TPA: hypothetical protein VD948_05100 [Rhodothermales bacterium]|nr:hypothetical protein [Rhodothermales bacterium]
MERARNALRRACILGYPELDAAIATCLATFDHLLAQPAVVSEAKRMACEMAYEWLDGYHGSIDSTALLLAHQAGQATGRASVLPWLGEGGDK